MIAKNDFFKKINNSEFLMFIIDEMAFNLEKSGKKIIRMTLGKSELPMNKLIKKKMKESLNSYKKYSYVFPSGLPELRNKIADFYNTNYNQSIKSENIIISTGTSTIFRNLYNLFLSKDDEVLIPRPYYSLYKFCALLVGANVKYYNINLKTQKIDMASFRKNFSSKTKIVVINSPGNPLGNILSEDEILEINGVVDDRAVIIFDEIYSNIYFSKKPVTALDILNKKKQNLNSSNFIITNAFSKGYRMYSRRVGWCIGSEELISRLTVIQHHTLLTVDPIVQYGGIVALDLQQDVEKIRNTYKQRMMYATRKFEKNSVIRMIPSKGGFYCTIDCRHYMKEKNIKNDFELAKDILDKIFVAVVPGTDFGIPGTLRLSFSDKKYCEGIDRICKYFAIQQKMN